VHSDWGSAVVEKREKMQYGNVSSSLHMMHDSWEPEKAHKHLLHHNIMLQLDVLKRPPCWSMVHHVFLLFFCCCFFSFGLLMTETVEVSPLENMK